jgi:hypothetical protein
MASTLNKDKWIEDSTILRDEAGWNDDKIMRFFDLNKDKYTFTGEATPNLGIAETGIQESGEPLYDSLNKLLNIAPSGLPISEQFGRSALGAAHGSGLARLGAGAGSFLPHLSDEFLDQYAESYSGIGEFKETRRDNLQILKHEQEKIEAPLHEKPAKSTFERVVRAGGHLVGIMPDFYAAGEIAAPVKGLKYVKNHPRIAKMLHESTMFGLASAMDGPEEMGKNFLVGSVFSLTGLAPTRITRSAVSGVLGGALSLIQGAEEEDAIAQAILFGTLGLIHGGKSKEAVKLLVKEAKLPKNIAEAKVGEIQKLLQGLEKIKKNKATENIRWWEEDPIVARDMFKEDAIKKHGLMNQKFQELKQAGQTTPQIRKDPIYRKLKNEWSDATKDVTEVEREIEFRETGKPSEVSTSPLIRSADKVTAQSQRAIDAVSKELGLSEVEYKGLMKQITGQESTELITDVQARKVVKELNKRAGRVGDGRPEEIKGSTVITVPQEEALGVRREQALKSGLMTNREYLNIVEKHTGKREAPRYISKEDYVTSSQAKKIMSDLHTEVRINKSVKPGENAAMENPEIAPFHKQARERLKIKETTSTGPAKTLTDSARYFFEKVQEVTGDPFRNVYDTIRLERKAIAKERDTLYIEGYGKAITEAAPGVNPVKEVRRIGDPMNLKSSDKIRTYLRNKKSGKKVPDLDRSELAVANEIEKIYIAYEPIVRYRKIIELISEGKEIPEMSNPKVKEQVDYALRVYDRAGPEAMRAVVEKQDWGVIKGGYDPHTNIVLNIDKATAATKVAKASKRHILPRFRKEPKVRQPNILASTDNYIYNMETAIRVIPEINGIKYMFKKNIDKFPRTESGKANYVDEGIEVWSKTITGGNYMEPGIERMLSKAYAQMMTATILAKPILAFRNIFQNGTLYVDKFDLIDPRNLKPLPEAFTEHFDTVTSNKRTINQWTFSQHLPDVPGLRKLNDWAHKTTLYPFSDEFNRIWAYFSKAKRVMRGVEAHKKGEMTFEELMTYSRFEDMSLVEQKTALEKYAKDGPEAMAMHIADTTVSDIHFLYDRAERSIAEQTKLGKWGLNLFLFPRAYGERLSKAARKMAYGDKEYINIEMSQAQRRGFKIMASTIVGGMAMDYMYNKSTGREGPYNPFNVFGFSFGGLAFGGVKTGTDVVGGIFEILNPATPDEFKSLAFTRLSTNIPRSADIFLPFYTMTIDSMESAIGKKNIDRLAIRELRSILDNEYKVRGGAYDVERTAIQSLQHAFAGNSIDRAIAQAEADKKKRIERIRKLRR